VKLTSIIIAKVLSNRLIRAVLGYFLTFFKRWQAVKFYCNKIIPLLSGSVG